MKTVIIVQARMTSTRLPGKVLKTVLGKPLLEYQIERLRRVKLADAIVIATTTNPTDDPIVALCTSLSIPYYRGSEQDVLSRYYEAAQIHQADVIVRVTSDCPLIDPQVIDQVIQYYIDHQDQYDYVSNSLERTYPRGMDTEVFSFKVLQEIFLEAKALPDREHVTPFIYRHSERYRLAGIQYVKNCSHYRWTVDTQEDFELITRMIEAIYPRTQNFTLSDCLSLVQNNPSWSTINAHIEQKKYDESINIGKMTNLKTEQEQFWSGEFGDEYTERNKGDLALASNTVLFAKIMARTRRIQSLIEFGANRGLNLQAIRQILPQIKLAAVEINEVAVKELQGSFGNEIEVFHQSILDCSPKAKYDFALIKGVLIHINPDYLEKVYDLLYSSSSRYICIAEYYNPKPVEVTYRSHEGKLFKRDFAGEMMDKFPDLKLLDYGFVYHRDYQFPQDDTTWFLLEKTAENETVN
jgi:spore coat polysaccharide biosynthesis protein SpsF